MSSTYCCYCYVLCILLTYCCYLLLRFFWVCVLLAEELTGSSESGEEEDGSSEEGVEPEPKRRRLNRLGSSVVRSATVLARTLVACEEKRERRHREVLELEERRLRLEEQQGGRGGAILFLFLSSARTARPDLPSFLSLLFCGQTLPIITRSKATTENSFSLCVHLQQLVVDACSKS